MNLGAEPRKLALLGVLGLLLVYFVWTNVLSPGEESTYVPPPAPAATATPAPGVKTPVESAQRPNIKSSRKRESSEYRPMIGRRPNANEPAVDPMTIDPTLRLDLIAKLQEVRYAGVGRNLFEFGGVAPEPAKPTTPDPKIPIRKPGLEPTRLARAAGPDTKPVPPPPPPPPQAPPIPLKYYGYVDNRSPLKRGFFLDGEDIQVAGEGQLIKRRYKVIRIGLTSVEMEDISFPGQRQTLPLVEEPIG
ncbi:MAG: hypothetical protein K2Q23_02545 [Bryobacteraceae bacterium]|nr:hypothetical protein [Bryobacteraceae bacterium]